MKNGHGKQNMISFRSCNW